MSALSKAMIETGLLSSDVLAQFKYWGLGDVNPDAAPTTIKSLQEIVGQLKEAIDSEDMVEIRATDLDIVHEYLSCQLKGRLTLPDYTTGKTNSFPITYSLTKLGEIVIPWASEDIRDLLIDPRACLKPVKGSGLPKYVFIDVRELFFGQSKAFLVCTPAKG